MMRAFLSDRSQQVAVGSALSASLPVLSGVPQGSILGPTFFLVYINDVVTTVERTCSFKLYADDSKFSQSRRDDENGPLVRTLGNFCEWAQSWQLRVAYEKCSVFSCGNLSLPELPYSLSGHQLDNVSRMRDIGVMMSSDLKSSAHCASIAASAHPRAHLIMKYFQCSNCDLLVRAFKTYVRPLLESCTPAWSPYLSKDIICIEKVQKTFTRRVCQRTGVTHADYSQRLSLLKLESLELRRLKFDMTMVFKIVRQLVDLSFDDFFVLAPTP